VQSAVSSGGWSPELIGMGIASLVLLFGLWWLYFLEPAGEGLERRRDLSFVWGYGHYGIFAALAALGAGLEVAAEAVADHVEAPEPVVALAVAVPVVVVLLLTWALHAPLGGAPVRELIHVSLACAGAVVGVLVVAAGGSLVAAVAVIAVAVALLVVRAVAVHGVSESVRATSGPR
jgi:low temperature requirement protein LtrA